MAQLKDSIISGNLRVTDDTIATTIQTKIIEAPTTSGGTTYGPGSNGQVLKSNGTTVYWGTDDNTTSFVATSQGTGNSGKFLTVNSSGNVVCSNFSDLVTTKAAATYTPGTSNQTIASGTYLTGAQTISGDANLKAENIKKDVTIFGITGTLTGGSLLIQDTTDTNGGTIRTITTTEDPLYLEPLSVTTNGTYTPDTNHYYSSVTVNVSSANSLQAKTNISPTESSQTITPDSGYIGLSSVQINAISSTYVGSGITQRSSSSLSASGATVTVPAGYYASEATKSVTTMTLPTSAASSATSGYTSKATIGRSTSAQYINIPPGYNSAGGYYTISAVANGTVTAPSSISGTSATVSTGTNTLTLTKTISVTPNVSTAGYISSGTAGNSSVSLTASVTVNPTPTASGATVTIPAGYYSSQTTKSVTSGSATGPTSLSGSSATVSTGTNTITLTKTSVTTTPTVSAGYVSSATASTATVTLTASVTTKAAATITPGTSNQTIASGTYLTGTQTISGDANLVAGNIISGKTIFGVAGSVVIQHYYTGTGTPSSTTGADGDIYLKTS